MERNHGGIWASGDRMHALKRKPARDEVLRRVASRESTVKDGFPWGSMWLSTPGKERAMKHLRSSCRPPRRRPDRGTPARAAQFRPPASEGVPRNTRPVKILAQGRTPYGTPPADLTDSRCGCLCFGPVVRLARGTCRGEPPESVGWRKTVVHCAPSVLVGADLGTSSCTRHL